MCGGPEDDSAGAAKYPDHASFVAREEEILLRRFTGLVCLAACLRCTAAHAEPMLPADRQALLLLKVLSYDYRLPQRAKKTVQILVLYRPEERASRQAGDSLLRALQALSGYTVHRLPVRATLVAYRGTAALDAQLAPLQASVIYLAPGLDAALPDILALTRKRSLVPVTGLRSYVVSGVPVGAILAGSLPRIAINQRAAQLHGMQLSSQLFKVAELVHGP